MSTWLPASIPLLLRAETCWTKNQSCADPINHKFYWHVEGFLIVSSKVFFPSSVMVWLICLDPSSAKPQSEGGKAPRVFLGKAVRDLGVAWAGFDVSLVPSRPGQDGQSQAPARGCSRARTAELSVHGEAIAEITAFPGAGQISGFLSPACCFICSGSRCCVLFPWIILAPVYLTSPSAPR